MSIILNRLRYVLSPQFDIYEQVAEVVTGKVADIGFGTGFGAHLLARKSMRTYCYEIDDELIEFAKRAFTYKNIRFQYGDIRVGIDGQFDFVVMIDVIEHIYQDWRAIENVKKCLLPGGTFICSTPNRLSRYRKSENHVKEYSPGDLETLLKLVFKEVIISNYKLQPIRSDYENPILGICQE